MTFLHRFDIYRKVPKDLSQPTSSGALISVVSILFVSFLFCSELVQFIKVDVDSELTVEDPVQKHSDTIPVFVNISLLKMECKYVGVDIVDEMGRHDVGYNYATQKFPLGHNNAGCRIESRFTIRKVPGNFHISTHSAAEKPNHADRAHIIHELYFGNIVKRTLNVKASFNPIENVDKSAAEALATHSHMYFLKVVPTVYEETHGNVFHPYQYTYSYKYMKTSEDPVIWFMHEVSPITVRYKETRKPFYTFLTKICAIVGGTFTVAGIIDSCVFTAAEVFKKAELGKLS